MFENRAKAGKLLAERLAHLKGSYGIVLAIPRGGVEVGYPIAKSLGLPLDVVITKKIGLPGNEEFAIGAVSSTGYVLTSGLDIPKAYIDMEVKRLKQLIHNRYELYMPGKKPSSVRGKTVILVDDGIATGSTMFSAIGLVKSENPQKVVVAVPVGPLEIINKLKRMVDEVECLSSPIEFYAIGEFYRDFSQKDDKTVVELLKKI